MKIYLGDDDMTLEKAIEKKRLYIVDLKKNEEIGVQNDLKARDYFLFHKFYRCQNDTVILLHFVEFLKANVESI